MSYDEDKCYICHGTNDLVKPCTNKTCTAKIHINCLLEQVQSNLNKCGCCKHDLAIIQHQKLNTDRLSTVLICIISWIILIMTSRGTQGCMEKSDNIIFDISAISVMWFVIFVSILRFSSTEIFDKRIIKYLPIISFVSSMIPHLMGYLTITYMCNTTEFFTCETSMTGVLSISIILMVVTSLIKICMGIIDTFCFIFYDTEIKYDTSVNT